MRLMCHVLLLSVLALSLLGGCAGPAVQIEPITDASNPGTQIFELEEQLSQAKAEEVNMLSPGWYAKAESYLDKARWSLAHQDSDQKILEMVAYGYAHLKRANEYSELAREQIPRAIEARRLANEAGAVVFSSDYQKLENQFLGLSLDIENNRSNRAQKYEAKVAQAYAELELRAIKENTLGKVRTLLSEAKQLDGDRHAPTMMAVARKALSDTDRFITDHRYEREQMQQKANFALFQAQRLKQIIALSQKFAQMEPETLALWSEGRLQQITEQLGARDLRNEANSLQLENIIQSIISLQDDNRSLNERHQTESRRAQEMAQRISALEGASAKVREDYERTVQKEQEFKARLASQQRFIEVQALFTPEQAEVYKQGDSLVIRLKGVHFPVGSDLIMPANYPLLSRVRQAIRSFGEPQVTIEGHTDSTGSAAANAILSRKRAEAVRQYFLANGTLNEELLSAIGFGPDRPLAANDTAAGRKLNRRIDVVIKANKTAAESLLQ